MKLITKNDIYTYLIREGVQAGFDVIPEFHVRIPKSEDQISAEETTRTKGEDRKFEYRIKDRRVKSIDLVWLTKTGSDGNVHQSDIWPRRWKIAAAFEIEGCNVPMEPEFQRHLDDFPRIEFLEGSVCRRFVFLYNNAYDRRPIDRKKWDEDVKKRVEFAEPKAPCIKVVCPGDDKWPSELTTIKDECRPRMK